MQHRFFFFLSESSLGCSESSRCFSCLNISSYNSVIFTLFLAEVSMNLTFHIFCKSVDISKCSFCNFIIYLQGFSCLSRHLPLPRLFVAFVSDKDNWEALHGSFYLKSNLSLFVCDLPTHLSNQFHNWFQFF